MNLRMLTLAGLLWVTPAIAQSPIESFLKEMQHFERNIISTYRAYQWLFYEEKQSQNELLAFEDLLGVYVKRLREAYETLSLIGDRSRVDDARDIAARAYIYRALTFLEKAPIDIRYFERACYDYYEALQLYESTSAVPAVFKLLPERIRIGTDIYGRLIDLLDAKGRDLFSFGQVHLLLRNFKVTSDFNEEHLTLTRYVKSGQDSLGYTYKLAEQKLKDAFRKAFQSDQPVEVYLALPAGIYYIRSTRSTPTDYVDLATIYVQPNQFISYIVEPIADWVIFYETPEYLIQSHLAAMDEPGLADGDPVAGELLASKIAGRMLEQEHKSAGDPAIASETAPERKERLEKLIEQQLERLPLNELEQLPIPRTRKEFISKVAQMMVNQKMGDYLNSWNRWTFAWNLAKQTTQYLQPGSEVSSAMVRLIHSVLMDLY
ncbi:MAG: hypothetical protein Q9P90_12815 [candidate division KSB1 bacterium]|nr:hypothetical protein [candidate division KSB1 bacterium]